MTLWHEDEAFWDGVGRFLFEVIRPESAAAAEADQVIRLLGSPEGAAVLDLACGTGRIALELARRGLRVTGVDRTTAYLATARSRAAEAGLPVELVEEDMRRFVRPGAFDAAVILFSSFGFFEDPEEDRCVLRQVHTCLRSGGTLLLDLVCRETLPRRFQKRTWHRHPSLPWFLLEEAAPRPDWSWIDVHWIVLRDGQVWEADVGVRLYSAPELERELRGAGFSEVRLYGSLDGAPLDDHAQRLVAVARR